MMLRRALLVLLIGVPSLAAAQFPGGPPDWVLIPAYPPRATDPAMVERGRNLYTANACSFCHGADARGGNGGPSLLRSQRVLRDKQGEMIAEPILKGVPNTTMVAFPLTQEQIAEIAEFLHSFPASGADKGRMRPVQFITGGKIRRATATATALADAIRRSHHRRHYLVGWCETCWATGAAG
jgi:mono/diheme cytochrome c family protein